MFNNKKKNSRSDLITGLIVGGAVASVATMMIAKKNKQALPEDIQKVEKPLSFWKKLFLGIFRLAKRFVKKD